MCVIVRAHVGRENERERSKGEKRKEDKQGGSVGGRGGWKEERERGERKCKGERREL